MKPLQRTSPGRTFAASLGFVAALFARSVSASAEPLSADQVVRLTRGETLVFEKTVVNDTHRYIGGVTYSIVEASPDEVADLLQDPQAYLRVLPRTKGARLVTPPGPSPTPLPEGLGRDFFVELRQGTQLMDTVYTLHVRKLNETRTVQFWMDPRMPHGIDDAWGFFRYQAIPEPAAPVTSARAAPTSVLLTYAILVDVGPGLVRELFEEKVRAALLSVPQRVRAYVHDTIRPGRPAKKT